MSAPAGQKTPITPPPESAGDEGGGGLKAAYIVLSQNSIHVHDAVDMID